jgi:hypothetical protein
MEFTDYIALGFFALMILGGLAMIYSGSRVLPHALASRSWPSVAGVVRNAEVSSKTSSSSSSGSSTTWYIDLTVGYTVNGKEHETGNVYFGFSGGSGDASAIRIEELRYQPGTRVPVYFDPKEPSRAVLRPGFDLDVLGLPVAGLAIALGGLAFTLVYLGAFKELPVFPLGIRVFGLIFLLAGCSMLTAGLWRFKQARDSTRWPVTNGAVVFSEKHSSTSVVEDSEGDRSRVQSHSAALAYRYQVDGVTYYSNIRRFGALAGASGGWAQAILDRYPTGAEVPVSYNPADPNTAVLEPGSSSESYWLPGAGAAFCLFGIAAFILGLRLRPTFFS